MSLRSSMQAQTNKDHLTQSQQIQQRSRTENWGQKSSYTQNGVIGWLKLCLQSHMARTVIQNSSWFADKKLQTGKDVRLLSGVFGRQKRGRFNYLPIVIEDLLTFFLPLGGNTWTSSWQRKVHRFHSFQLQQARFSELSTAWRQTMMQTEFLLKRISLRDLRILIRFLIKSSAPTEQQTLILEWLDCSHAWQKELALGTWICRSHATKMSTQTWHQQPNGIQSQAKSTVIRLSSDLECQVYSSLMSLRTSTTLDISTICYYHSRLSCQPSQPLPQSSKDS